MKIALKFICLLILFNSCKLASIEKRRYRHGFFVQTRTEKQKPKEQQACKTKSTIENAEVLRIESKKEILTEETDLVASTETLYKVNINKLLPTRTTFVNEHVKKKKHHTRHKKKLVRSHETDTLIVELILLLLGLLWVVFSYGLHYMIPAISLPWSLVICGAVMLTLLILLFLGVKKNA